MEELASRLLETLVRYGYLAILVITVVEEAGVPSPIPGDGLLLFAGYLASRGNLSFVGCLVTVDVGALVGASILYWLARRGGRRAVQRYGRMIRLSERRLGDLERLFARLGVFGPGVSRLIPGLRIYTSALAGLAVVPFQIFLMNVVWACTVWALAFLWLGYFAGGQWRTYSHLSQQATLYGGAVIVVAGAAYWFLHQVRRRRGKSGPTEQASVETASERQGDEVDASDAWKS